MCTRTARLIMAGAAIAALCMMILSVPAWAQRSARPAARAIDGKPIYQKWCAGCHGDTGAGDGFAANTLLPRPRDFTRGVYELRSTATGELPTDRDLALVVEQGIPGTAMPGWKEKFSADEILAVVRYLKTLSSAFTGPAPKPILLGRAPKPSPTGLAEGQAAYQKLECAKCHGVLARGDGPSAPGLTDDAGFPSRVTNLTHAWNFNGGGTVEQIYLRLRTGMDGTPMPSQSEAVQGGIITDQQLWRLAEYVRSLSPGIDSSGGPIHAPLVGLLPTSPGDSGWRGATRYWVPLVGQIIVRPRWFTPTVDGVWVQALHDSEHLALRVVWDDPSHSPDSSYQPWLEHVAATLSQDDGAIATEQGPDRFVVQFPLHLTGDSVRPYFLSGGARLPAYVWRWSSDRAVVAEGSTRGYSRFAAREAPPETVAAATFDHGQWSVQFTRALIPTDTLSALRLETGRDIPIAFFAADGSNGETGPRGSVSGWHVLYLDSNGQDASASTAR